MLIAYAHPSHHSSQHSHPRTRNESQELWCVDRVSRWGAAGCLEGMRGAECSKVVNFSEGRELLYIIFLFFLFLPFFSFSFFLLF